MFKDASVCRWIWDSSDNRPGGSPRYLLFRRRLLMRGPARRARLHITADSRYELWINDQSVGAGPARSWPEPWPVDVYDLGSMLTPGENVIAVRVHHFGVGTMAYLPCDAGLLAELEIEDDDGPRTIPTDARWCVQTDDTFSTHTPRINVQMGWEEQIDARREQEGWREVGFDDQSWSEARVVRSAGELPHARFEDRDIPFLTATPRSPSRVVACEVVRPADYHAALNLRPILNPDDVSANVFKARLLVATRIHSPIRQEIAFHQFIYSDGYEWAMNGSALVFDDHSTLSTDSGVARCVLEPGWNTLSARVPDLMHSATVAVSIWNQDGQPFDVGPWSAIGPFAFDPNLGESHLEKYYCTPPFIHPRPEDVNPDWQRFLAIVADRTLLTESFVKEFGRPLPRMLAVTAACAADRVVADEQPTAVELAALAMPLSDQWATVAPPARGHDARVLLDFGDEVVGYIEYDLDAPAGTLLDAHCFEFIPHGGRPSLSETMCNGFRYTARQGVQHVRSAYRRGFRYCWLTIRNMSAEVRIRRVRVVESTYPQRRQGTFECSDSMLQKIWETAARSVACCSEDTYTDCPSYEQVHWVGDSRNESMVDLVVNGDPRLSRHSWMQAARSLNRSPIVESHVPSSWTNIIPAWSLLWMRWAQEYFQFTGDLEFASQAIPWLDRNVAGFRKNINANGLIEIHAWNMFDWAPMDTPTTGVVTHQNCLAVMCLNQAAMLADRVSQTDAASRWRLFAGELKSAIHEQLWDRHKQSYYDSVSAAGQASSVYSQQTQAVAVVAGVAEGDRRERCLAIARRAPQGYVTPASPFFMFFMLELLAGQGEQDEMLAMIRDYWGRQIDAGATTFWECYTPEARRPTRSYCHGWSSAPTYFLTHDILGVQPAEPGFARVRIAPRGNLARCRGVVPTPHGRIECEWSQSADSFELRAVVPAGLPTRIDLAVRGDWQTSAGVSLVSTGEAGLSFDTHGQPEIRIQIRRQLMA